MERETVFSKLVEKGLVIKETSRLCKMSTAVGNLNILKLFHTRCFKLTC